MLQVPEYENNDGRLKKKTENYIQMHIKHQQHQIDVQIQANILHEHGYMHTIIHNIQENIIVVIMNFGHIIEHFYIYLRQKYVN